MMMCRISVSLLESDLTFVSIIKPDSRRDTQEFFDLTPSQPIG